MVAAPQQTDTFEYYATEHFRLSGVYWGLTAMALLGRLHEMDEAAIVAWVCSCQARLTEAACACVRSAFNSNERLPHTLVCRVATNVITLVSKRRSSGIHACICSG